MQPDDPKRDQILQRVRERIVAYASSRIGAGAAEDLAQDTVMLLNAKYPHIGDLEDLVPLAIRIMQYKIREQRRDRLAAAVPTEHMTLEDGALDPEQQARYEQLQKKIMSAIEHLGGRCRQLFLLKLDGYNFEEIRARMRANTLQAVYTWDFRCKKDLRKLMTTNEGRS